MDAFIPVLPLWTHWRTDYRSGHYRSGLSSPKCAHSMRKGSRSITMTAEQEQRVLVLGGTGRVGTETIKALTRITPVPLSVSVAGRNSSKGRNVCRDLAAIAKKRRANAHPVTYTFTGIDINDEASLVELIAGHDLVVHTAGPFQRKEKPTLVLQSAIRANVPYMDICDDSTHAKECKKLHEVARARGCTALISTGIYPGLSNLMAAEACERLGDERVDSLKIYYHTAGSGGIGAAVLASTFLLLGEDVICYDELGEERRLPSAGEAEVVDFGGRLDRKITTYLLNLPEVVSLHDNLFKDGSRTELFAKFSTGPALWNWLLQVMARWTPKEWLANRSAMLAFARFSLPVVKAVDMVSGALTAIKVVAEGPYSLVKYSFEHERLATCVGEASASFAFQLLKRNVNKEKFNIGSGVFYPEELCRDVRVEVLNNATLTANLFRAKASLKGGQSAR